jgi:hypothetical protein
MLGPEALPIPDDMGSVRQEASGVIHPLPTAYHARHRVLDLGAIVWVQAMDSFLFLLRNVLRNPLSASSDLSLTTLVGEAATNASNETLAQSGAGARLVTTRMRSLLASASGRP